MPRLTFSVPFARQFARAVTFLGRPFGVRAAMTPRQMGAAARGKASISHTVTRACPRCQAPGVFLSETRIRADWSGCYVVPGDSRENKSVGAFCPNCGAPRGADLIEERGTVWRGEI